MYKIKRHTALIFLLVYIGYFSCASFFVHTHIYKGVLYIHSHPFHHKNKDNKPTPFEADHHTLGTFFTLNQLSNILSGTTNDNSALKTILTSNELLFSAYIPHNIIKPFRYQFNLRAPPLNSFI